MIGEESAQFCGEIEFHFLTPHDMRGSIQMLRRSRSPEPYEDTEVAPPSKMVKTEYLKTSKSDYKIALSTGKTTSKLRGMVPKDVESFLVKRYPRASIFPIMEREDFKDFMLQTYYGQQLRFTIWKGAQFNNAFDYARYGRLANQPGEIIWSFVSSPWNVVVARYHGTSVMKYCARQRSLGREQDVNLNVLKEKIRAHITSIHKEGLIHGLLDLDNLYLESEGFDDILPVPYNIVSDSFFYTTSREELMRKPERIREIETMYLDAEFSGSLEEKIDNLLKAELERCLEF